MDPPAGFSLGRFALERSFEQSRFACQHWAFVYELVLPVVQRSLSARSVGGAPPKRRVAERVSVGGGARR
jgi:hypothetical protein